MGVVYAHSTGSSGIYLGFSIEKACKKTRILDKKGALMAKYTELAWRHSQTRVGGKENVYLNTVWAVCTLDLKDESKADDDYLKNRDGVVAR